jgi:hypothetical protein
MRLGEFVGRVIQSLTLVAVFPCLCLPLCLPLTGCGPSGACVAAADIVGVCYDDLSEDECTGTSWTYYDGESCSSLGFTEACPESECQDCWCKP